MIGHPGIWYSVSLMNAPVDDTGELIVGINKRETTRP